MCSIYISQNYSSLTIFHKIQQQITFKLLKVGFNNQNHTNILKSTVRSYRISNFLRITRDFKIRLPAENRLYNCSAPEDFTEPKKKGLFKGKMNKYIVKSLIKYKGYTMKIKVALYIILVISFMLGSARLRHLRGIIYNRPKNKRVSGTKFPMK
jgi:hypothetical protein